MEKPASLHLTPEETALLSGERGEALGPAAILLTAADVNIAVGALVAERLYGTETPVLLLDADAAGKLHGGEEATIGRDGTVTVASKTR